VRRVAALGSAPCLALECRASGYRNRVGYVVKHEGAASTLAPAGNRPDTAIATDSTTTPIGLAGTGHGASLERCSKRHVGRLMQDERSITECRGLAKRYVGTVWHRLRPAICRPSKNYALDIRDCLSRGAQ